MEWVGFPYQNQSGKMGFGLTNKIYGSLIKFRILEMELRASPSLRFSNCNINVNCLARNHVQLSIP